MSAMPSPTERRRANRLRHHQERQQRQAARGPAGVAASWWDHARAIAKDVERSSEDPDEAWHDLALTLENWCQRYSE